MFDLVVMNNYLDKPDNICDNDIEFEIDKELEELCIDDLTDEEYESEPEDEYSPEVELASKGNNFN